jgi:hypothetical protein
MYEKFNVVENRYRAFAEKGTTKLYNTLFIVFGSLGTVAVSLNLIL